MAAGPELLPEATQGFLVFFEMFDHLERADKVGRSPKVVRESVALYECAAETLSRELQPFIEQVHPNDAARRKEPLQFREHHPRAAADLKHITNVREVRQ